MEKIHLFIDTSEYVKWHFDTTCSKAVFLEKNAKIRNLQIYSNNIIIGECLRHISKYNDDIRRIINLINRIEKNELRQMKKRIIEELDAKICNEFEYFLKRCNCLNIDLNGVDIELIIKNFFKCNAPFSSQKKEEFPDAIAINSIELFVKQNKIDKFYIISSDGDWGNSLRENINIICFKEWKDFIEEFDEICKKHNEKYKEVSDYANKIFLDNCEEIILKIRELLNDIQFDTDYIDGEVYINKINLDIPTISLYEYSEERVTLSILHNVHFDIELSYTDYENAVWDKEDKRYVFLEDIITERRIEENIEVLLDINRKDNTFKIKSVNDSKPIYLTENDFVY